MLKVRIFDIFTVRLGTVIPAAPVLHFSKPETSSNAVCPKWLLLHSVNDTTFDSTHTDPLDGHTATCHSMLSTTFPSVTPDVRSGEHETREKFLSVSRLSCHLLKTTYRVPTLLS